jgi:hypothetical protein
VNFSRRTFGLAAATAAALPAQPRKWWMEEPVRLVQANLRETDTALDPARLIAQVEELHANALLLGLGGIVAHYPTEMPFHYRSRSLPAGADMFGAVLRLAHARHIRVIGRFDLSKTQKPVYDAHPEWFFQKADGTPVIYNGLYSTCINGGYYRDHALKILAEALGRYEVDGLFFNMFGNPASDYSGQPTGDCRCRECKRREAGEASHAAMLAVAKNEVAQSIGELIHRKRPAAAFWTYIQDHVDGIMSESNTAVDRPLPLWPYSASDNVNRARNSKPDKMAFNLCIGFVDIPYRYTTVAPAEVQMRLYQNMAHGAGPAFVALGTLDQEDRSGLAAAKEVFGFHKRNEELYTGQESAARVLLLGGRGAAYQGLFRLLSERHIPFAVSDNFEWIGRQEFDVVVCPDGVPPDLEPYWRSGGRILAVGAVEPAFGIPRKPRKRWSTTRSAYLRIKDRTLLPGLPGTNLLFLDGPFLEYEPDPKAAITLIPPAMYGPPERVGVDATETAIPGIILGERLIVLPWQTGALYHRHSSPAHAALVADLLAHLQPRPQLGTNAHPLVEITLMRQPRRGRTLLHLVNLSGHAGTAYFPPVEMRDIEVRIDGRFQAARLATGETISVAQEQGYSHIRVPSLRSYNAVILS